MYVVKSIAELSWSSSQPKHIALFPETQIPMVAT